MNEAANPFIQISGEISFLPTKAEPIEGYEEPENFPNCCPFHTWAFGEANKWFEKFPNCCNPHSEMAAKGRIKKSDYEGLPRKVLYNLSYTEYHLAKQIDIPEWYEDITNYIDYIFWSFGQPAAGIHLYVQYLKHYLKVSKKIPTNKRRRLIEYIDDYTKPVEDASKFDFHVIYNTFQKWVKTFPFDLPYFKGLKQQFEGQVPAFNGPARFNPYTGLAKAKGITQIELIDALELMTKRLIGEVQTDKFQISDMNKHRVQLANESLRVGTAKIVVDYSKRELRYVNAVKRWLELQKEYFREIAGIMGNPINKVGDSRPLAPYFHSSDKLDLALQAAAETGLLNNGKWAYIGEKTNAVSIFWIAVVTARLAKADAAANKVSRAMEKQFDMDLGVNAINKKKKIADFEATYRELHKNLLSIMRP